MSESVEREEQWYEFDKMCLHGIVGDTMRSCWTQRVNSEDEWRGECDGREGRVK